MKTKNNKSKILIAAFIFTITLLIIGVSYAYFTATANNNNNQQMSLETGTLSLIFSDNNNGFNVQLQPGESAEKTFTIQNNSDVDAAASMSFVNLINTYMADSLIYSLSYCDTEDGRYKYISIDNVPTSSTRVTRDISNGIIVPANTTYYYKFRVRLVNLHETNQNADTNATMNTKFKIDGVYLPDNTGKSDQTLQKLQSLNNTITVTNGSPDFNYTNDGKYYDENEIEQTDSTKISNGIYAMEDDYGMSYYFRGDVNNNYVHFGGYYWRILRINGDGTLRLLYDGSLLNERGTIGAASWNVSNSIDAAYSGYMYGYEHDSSADSNYTIYETKAYEEANINKYNSTIKDYIDNWYSTNLASQSSKIADTLFCNDRFVRYTGYGKKIGTLYEIVFRNRKGNFAPMLKCLQKNDAFTVSDTLRGNASLTNPIGLASLDELVVAGNSYATAANSYTYMDLGYWTFSPYHNIYATKVNVLGSGRAIYADAVFSSLDHAKPVINLTQNAVISMTGSGTISDPFEA